MMGGTFGVGGGVIVVPLLVMAFGFSQLVAQGTMIATFVLPSFLLAAWMYYKEGSINVPAACLIATGMLLGTFLGAKFAHTLPAPALKKAFGVLVVLIGLKLILWK